MKRPPRRQAHRMSQTRAAYYRSGRAALSRAVNLFPNQRPLEARITGFGYAPSPPTTRGSEPEKFDYRARDRARALIQLEAAEHPSAQA